MNIQPKWLYTLQIFLYDHHYGATAFHTNIYDLDKSLVIYNN